jgi:type I restriction enzyme R subunit
VQGAMAVYTSELEPSGDGSNSEVLLQDRLQQGRERLEGAREALSLLCEPVQPPKGILEHLHYFCGNPELPEDLKAHEPQRVALYQSVAALLRAYANIADDLSGAGYTEAEVAVIRQEVEHSVRLREAIRHNSGESIDLKAYEADMRHLIDTYIRAEVARSISGFGEMGLLELITRVGLLEAVGRLPGEIRDNPRAVAETIANNVRSKIKKEHLNDPVLYDRMSALLDEILADLKAQRTDYREFLKRMEELARQVQAGRASDTPDKLDTPGKRALYNHLMQASGTPGAQALGEGTHGYGTEASNRALELALRIDETVREKRQDSFRGNKAKENILKAALLPLLDNDTDAVERMFNLIKNQPEY